MDTEKSVQDAIEALERLMDQEDGKRQAKHVVVFRVFVGEHCVSGRAPFFLDAEAANRYYSDLVQGLGREALLTDARATRATVQLHNQQNEWLRARA